MFRRVEVRSGGLLLLLALSGVGCASGMAAAKGGTTAAGGGDRLSQWVGHDVKDVVASLGAPTAVVTSDGAKTYQWRWTNRDTFSDRSTATVAWIEHERAGVFQCRESYAVDEKDVVVRAEAFGTCPADASMSLEQPAAQTVAQ